MAVGKLYFDSNEFIVDVNYQLHDESKSSWWGELIPTEYSRHLGDGDGFVIELEDGRQGRCSLRKRINRAVSGTPPRYYYYFRGHGRLE